MSEDTPGGGRHARGDDADRTPPSGWPVGDSGDDQDATVRSPGSGDAERTVRAPAARAPEGDTDADATVRTPTGAESTDPDATTRTTAASADAPADPSAETSAETAVTTPSESGSGEDGDDEPRRGRVRYQDPETSTPREPTVAEQRARRESQRRDRAQREAAQAAEERKRKIRKRVLIGGGVAVGVVAVVAIAYAASQPDEVTANCTDANGFAVEDRFCTGTQSTGSYGGGIVPIFIPFGGGPQYHYNYGTSAPVGSRVSGGTTTPPASGTSVRSGSSGASIGSSNGSGSVSRGGLGVSGSSSGSSGSGSSSSGS